MRLCFEQYDAMNPLVWDLFKYKAVNRKQVLSNSILNYLKSSQE